VRTEARAQLGEWIRPDERPDPSVSTDRASRSTATISVVVCTRDRADSLRATLASVLATTPGPLELLVVDNAPRTESTRALVRELDDPRVRYVLERVPGLSRARNRGLAEARGEIIAFTDDDVLVDKLWLRGLERGFARDPGIGAVTGIVAAAELETRSQQIFESAVAWTTNCLPRVWSPSDPPPGDVLFPYTAGQFGTGANFALRRDLAPVVGLFDEALGVGTPTGGGEDLDMFLRVLQGGFKLAFEPSALVWHRHRRDPEALRSQMFSYSAGLAAYACKQLLRRETRSDVASRVPAAMLRAGRITARGARSREMLLARVSGYVCGPFLYAKSRRSLEPQNSVTEG
jgi:glycosyltransferase involved in cell wall biosynthesis